MWSATETSGSSGGLGDVDPDKTRVEEATTQEPYRIAPHTTVREVVKTMVEHKYGSALVEEGGKITGIFTTHDALVLLDKVLG